MFEVVDRLMTEMEELREKAKTLPFPNIIQPPPGAFLTPNQQRVVKNQRLLNQIHVERVEKELDSKLATYHLFISSLRKKLEDEESSLEQAEQKVEKKAKKHKKERQEKIRSQRIQQLKELYSTIEKFKVRGDQKSQEKAILKHPPATLDNGAIERDMCFKNLLPEFITRELSPTDELFHLNPGNFLVFNPYKRFRQRYGILCFK